MSPGAEAQTGHSSFVVRAGESAEYLSTTTGEVHANLSATPDSHCYVHSAMHEKVVEEAIWYRTLFFPEVNTDF